MREREREREREKERERGRKREREGERESISRQQCSEEGSSNYVSLMIRTRLLGERWEKGGNDLMQCRMMQDAKQ